MRPREGAPKRAAVDHTAFVGHVSPDHDDLDSLTAVLRVVAAPCRWGQFGHAQDLWVLRPERPFEAQNAVSGTFQQSRPRVPAALAQSDADCETDEVPQQSVTPTRRSARSSYRESAQVDAAIHRLRGSTCGGCPASAGAPLVHLVDQD